MIKPSAAAVIAAAKIIYAAGAHHGWWNVSAVAYEQLDRISRSEFDGIIQDALNKAFAAQAVAAAHFFKLVDREPKPFPSLMDAVAAEGSKPVANDLERARQALRRGTPIGSPITLCSCFSGVRAPRDCKNVCEDAAEWVAAAISEAVSVERERCAQIAFDRHMDISSDFDEGYDSAVTDIVDAIRAADR